MAIRSPVQIHNFWGATFADAAALPNKGGAPLSANEFKLEAGDFAYVVLDTTFYICTSPGGVSATPPATWIPLSTGGGSALDRFAPKHLVGFAPSGDPGTDFSANGFYYWADDGSGNGIRAALLAAASNVPGDVWIRPGTYNLTPEDTALVIPPKTRVQGAGATTVIQKSVIAPEPDASTLTIFTMRDNAELRDVYLAQTLFDAQDPYLFAGSGVVETVPYTVGDTSVFPSVHVERVSVNVNDGLNFAHSANAVYVGAGCSLEADRCSVALTGTGQPDEFTNVLGGWRIDGDVLETSRMSLDACTVSGGDIGVVALFLNSGCSLSVDQCHVSQFGYAGISTASGDIAVTGGTQVVSTNTSVGIACSDGEQLPAKVLINARVSVPNAEEDGSVGMKLAVTSGQVFGSHVEGSFGIISGGSGLGVAIGFNSVISQPGQQISAQLVDEVAHNILTT